MAKVVIYTKNQCPYCRLAKEFFNSRKIPFEEIQIEQDPAKLEEMINLSGGRRTVPQIFINDKAIGGYDDLAALAKSKQLDGILSS